MAMKQRRGTAAAWTAANSVLAAGQLGIETDTGFVKVGDGSTAWNSLGYILKGSTYAPAANPTFTGTVTVTGNLVIGPNNSGYIEGTRTDASAQQIFGIDNNNDLIINRGSLDLGGIGQNKPSSVRFVIGTGASKALDILDKDANQLFIQDLNGTTIKKSLNLTAAPAITDAAPHNMTANNAPSPFVASASSVDGSVAGAYVAFDGSLSGGHIWVAALTSTGWLQLDLGSGNAVTVVSYAIACGTQGWNGTQMPKNWTFQGSNDASSWTTVDTRTNETGWGDGEKRTYTCAAASATAFRYWRINVTANNGDPYLSIAEMYIYPAKKGQFEYVDDGTDGHLYFTHMAGGVLTRTPIV